MSSQLRAIGADRGRQRSTGGITVAAIDETTVTLSATARLLPGQPRKPRALGLQASGLVQFYSTSFTGVDLADALSPLHDCVHSITCTDVLR
eukprot:CAMPEP_0185456056 /NCGR_PEP_ID=MMETSP1365-20130426/76637_1 /TAXON_ID=38817 /ORGANISM="Gephyrocapsa oceanica, Strain RCC1303" /LENGTH=91 /DNA_ID=CAMNT_0028062467 /DNA_START=48 /DNA_END=323 /DNA_ORIENTATION=+